MVQLVILAQKCGAEAGTKYITLGSRSRSSAWYTKFRSDLGSPLASALLRTFGSDPYVFVPNYGTAPINGPARHLRTFPPFVIQSSSSALVCDCDIHARWFGETGPWIFMKCGGIIAARVIVFNYVRCIYTIYILIWWRASALYYAVLLYSGQFSQG